MNKEYEEIQFVLGSTIEQAVNELLRHKKYGKLVCGKFNDVTLYSDTVTIDDAYKKITGKTRAELDKAIRFKAKKDIYWEDWGRMKRVFVAGRVYEGVLHSDGSVTACSPYYDVDDYVSRDEIEILN